jgi:hypothetical protein
MLLDVSGSLPAPSVSIIPADATSLIIAIAVNSAFISLHRFFVIFHVVRLDVAQLGVVQLDVAQLFAIPLVVSSVLVLFIVFQAPFTSRSPFAFPTLIIVSVPPIEFELVPFSGFPDEFDPIFATRL